MDNIIAEIHEDYYRNIKKSIVDYALKDEYTRTRLGIPI